MHTDKIKVLVVEPGRSPDVREISSSLHGMQDVIGGYLQTIPLDKNNIIVCNAAGKADNLAANMRIFIPNEVDEFIYGPFLVAGYDMRNQDFTSINEEGIQKCKTIFKH